MYGAQLCKWAPLSCDLHSKHKWHQNGSLWGTVWPSVKQGLLGPHFGATFQKAIHFSIQKQCHKGTKIVPFQRKGSRFPKIGWKRLPSARWHSFRAPGAPFPTFFYWKIAPQWSQNGATFDGKAPFQSFFLKTASFGSCFGKWLPFLRGHHFFLKHDH